jgi:hypothetical protein
MGLMKEMKKVIEEKKANVQILKIPKAILSSILFYDFVHVKVLERSTLFGMF